jgi:hypothetical protein
MSILYGRSEITHPVDAVYHLTILGAPVIMWRGTAWHSVARHSMAQRKKDPKKRKKCPKGPKKTQNVRY